MPAAPRWLTRLPAIIRQLQALDVPVLDRAIVEELFGVGRRRAIQLLAACGGYQSGRTFLADRAQFVAVLERLAATPGFHYEQRRRERLAASLERLRKLQAGANVRVPVDAEVFSERVADLPAGVRLAPGRLEIVFETPEDLLAKLFALAQAASNDFARFACQAGAAPKDLPL